MPLAYENTELQIPRGRVFFDPFDTNGNRTGERAFGNCPAFTLTVASTKFEHYSSETGLRQKDASATIEVNRTGKLSSDNMTAGNLALFLSGEEETVSQALGTVSNEAHTVIQGRFYQLGQTESNPAGVRNVTAVVVTDVAGTTTYIAGTDYNVDLPLGRLQIIKGGAIADADVVHVDYSRPVATWSRIKTGANSEITGALRIVADAAIGANRDWYMPKVTLTPDGDIPVIQDGTDAAKMGFGVEVLKPANAEAIYIDGRPA